jgi:GTP-binding protein HflX
VVLPWSGRTGAEEDSDALRPAEARLEEACALAVSIGLHVRWRTILPLRTPRPSTLLGGGQVEQIAQEVKLHGIAVTVVDAQLSPVQQRNLERAWGC